MFSSFSLGKGQFLLKGHQTETDFRLERDLSASLVTSEMFHPGSPFPIAEFIFMLHKQIRPQHVTMTDDDHTSALLPRRIIDTSYLWLIVDWHINIVFTSSSSLVLTARKKQEMAIQRRYLGRAWKREKERLISDDAAIMHPRHSLLCMQSWSQEVRANVSHTHMNFLCLFPVHLNANAQKLIRSAVTAM